MNRFDLAFPQGAPDGPVLLIGAQGGDDLSVFDPDRTTILQTDFAEHRALSARGFAVVTVPEAQAATAVVTLPRARALGRARIAQAVAELPDGADLWIDGQRTDGIEAALKELRGLTEVQDVHSKAHGKIFRVTVGGWLPADWASTAREAAPGFHTLPGVFSADGIDPGSALLAAALPPKLPTRMVDLGAGWGWLSAQVLARNGVEKVHLVEADHTALQSARGNIADPRAEFQWADARDFTLREPVNGVVMNPPFHSGRDADPALGRAFIASAARLLTQAGRLWMVANRHLAYENTLDQHFGKVTEIGGNGVYKLFEASGARSAKRRGVKSDAKGKRA